jgi:hypothetical protein
VSIYELAIDEPSWTLSFISSLFRGGAKPGRGKTLKDLSFVVCPFDEALLNGPNATVPQRCNGV